MENVIIAALFFTYMVSTWVVGVFLLTRFKEDLKRGYPVMLGELVGAIVLSFFPIANTLVAIGLIAYFIYLKTHDKMKVWYDNASKKTTIMLKKLLGIGE